MSIAANLQARARPFLDLVDAMRKDGVQKKITIPQIAVMGDQSSGKSSVLEQISGVQFPRGSGLVTRCATQIIMSRGETWSAELRATGDDSNDVRRVTYEQQAELERHINELTSKLCGEQGFSGPDKFIEVKLVAPDAPDLTIIDLPGIVRTHTAGQNKAVKEQVDSLLKHFLEQERTIILAVIPVNVDIATVDILERASKVDPEGERTIGVLTKPDLVDKGGEVEVMNVLANRTKPLRHGYFMLKNRSQEELKAQQGKIIPHSEARTTELTWLKSSHYKQSDRLGVQVLQTALTELLVTQIEKALPSMQEEVEKVLTDTEAELEQLGTAPPPSESGRRMAALAKIRNIVGVLRRITSFADAGTIDISTSSPLVLQRELLARKKFAEAIDKTRPGFDGENDCFDEEVIETKQIGIALSAGVKRKSVGEILKAERWREPQSITKVGQTMTVPFAQHGYTKGKIIKVEPYFRGDLAKRIQAGRGRELPGFMNFDVFTAEMRKYIQFWQQPTREFCETIWQTMSEASTSTVQLYTGKLPRLADLLQVKLQEHVNICGMAAEKRLKTLLEPENLPSTENHYLFDTINKIRNKRMEKKINDMPSDDNRVEKAAVVAMLQSNIGNDSNESQEVQDMIDFLAAYWKVAMKRYVDEVCMVITDCFTAPRQIDELETKLTEAVMAIDNRRLERLFQMDSHIERRRMELEDTRTKMMAARQRIADFTSE